MDYRINRDKLSAGDNSSSFRRLTRTPFDFISPILVWIRTFLDRCSFHPAITAGVCPIPKAVLGQESNYWKDVRSPELLYERKGVTSINWFLCKLNSRILDNDLRVLDHRSNFQPSVRTEDWKRHLFQSFSNHRIILLFERERVVRLLDPSSPEIFRIALPLNNRIRKLGKPLIKAVKVI